MPHSKLFFRGKNLFLFHKTEPRKVTSRSPFNFTADEYNREMGPKYQTIDLRIGNQKMILDIAQGIWILDETAIDSQNMTVLERRKRELEEDNNMFRVKLDILLEMLAETTAEEEFHVTQSEKTES